MEGIATINVASYRYAMTQEVDWKESVRLTLSRAQDRGLRLVDVEAVTGISPQRLSNFVSKGHLGTNEVRLLDLYFAERNPMVHEDAAAYNPMIARDCTCPQCGELTPGPREGSDMSPFWCIWCGELLATVCVCGTLETRRDGLFCRSCGKPLTWDAAEVRLSVNRATEPRKDRLDREAKKKELHRKERKKRGDPEM